MKFAISEATLGSLNSVLILIKPVILSSKTFMCFSNFLILDS